MSGRAGGLYGGIQFSTTKPISSQEPPVVAVPAPVVPQVVASQAPVVEQSNDSGQASSKAPAGIAHPNLTFNIES